MNTQSNLHQAAVILKSLPKSQAARILSRLQMPDVKQVMDAVSQLDRITADQLSESLDRLNRESSPRQLSTRSASEREFLEHHRHPPTAQTPPLSNSNSAAQEGPFQFLLEAMPALRDQVLRDEHPKNVAIVLSSLPPEIASQCLNSLDPASRVSVLKRICELDEIRKEEVNQLGYELRLRFNKLSSRQSYRSSGLKSAADLLSYSDLDSQETLFELMAQSDPELAKRLQKNVVKIEDLARYDDEGIRRLLGLVNTAHWAPALKRAPVTILRKIIKNMAPKPALMLREEMERLENLDAETEAFARQQIIKQTANLN